MRGILLLCFLEAVGALQNYTWDPPGTENADEVIAVDTCLTDKGSCGCCVMQKLMKQMEHYFNLTITELNRELEEAQETLSKIQASRSAFSVALTDSSWCFGPFRTEMIVKYQVSFLNLGNDYNKSTGNFVAPRSGVYVFAVTAVSDSGSPGTPLAACVILRVNNLEVASISEKNDQDQEDSGTVVLTVQLNAGDHVAVYMPPGCFLCDSKQHLNTFTGFLLYSTK
ncbi:cerebellin 20 isoform X2 [Scleropages formosus]|uniref:cerebellin 20 isoform X2 n=1 Tax=Scleropages formosus TaxID=113540 RepID=UPI0008788249|nr:complement C1q-like protein 3 isoform X2 [Scleropages formosus]